MRLLVLVVVATLAACGGGDDDGGAFDAAPEEDAAPLRLTSHSLSWMNNTDVLSIPLPTFLEYTSVTYAQSGSGQWNATFTGGGAEETVTARANGTLRINFPQGLQGVEDTRSMPFYLDLLGSEWRGDLQYLRAEGGGVGSYELTAR